MSEKMCECMNIPEDCVRELGFELCYLNFQACTGDTLLYNILAAL